MNSPGLLICGYNRPENLARILESSSLELFESITISLDVSSNLESRSLLRNRYKNIISNSKYSNRVSLTISDRHLGLYSGMRKAIDTAFERYETCVILEEDCVPGKNLGKFIYELYRFHPNYIRESHICFSRHVPRNGISSDLTFTKYPFVWGWMGSRQLWEAARIEAHLLNRSEVLNIFQNLPGAHDNFVNHWIKMFDACVEVALARNNNSFQYLDTSDRFISWALNSWATPYTIAYWVNSGGSPAIRPHSNFVKNIGFGKLASHTFKKPKHARRIDAFHIETSRSVPYSISKYDTWEDQNVFGIPR